ncbi:MAG: bactofilin family protein [Chloroflexota bacterium]
MFKKTEDSEWSRFSRALSGQSRAGADDEVEDGVVAKDEPAETAPPAREAVVREAPVREPAVREAVARESAPREAVARESVTREIPQPAAPAAAPVRTAPSVQSSYSRPHAPAISQEADESETIIGGQTVFDGTLKCESNLRVKGTAQGEIACSKSVIIEESAKVNANVRAANAVVAGQLEGSIVCDGRLEILATGKVAGELTAGVLIIQEGAFFEGHLKMKDRSQ